MERTDWPARSRSPISTRSSSEKNRAPRPVSIVLDAREPVRPVPARYGHPHRPRRRPTRRRVNPVERTRPNTPTVHDAEPEKLSPLCADVTPKPQHADTHHFPYLTRSLAAIPLPCTRGQLRELWAIMPGRPQLGRQEVLLDPCLPIPVSLPSVSESESHWRLVLLLQPDSHDSHCGVGSANGYLRVAR